MKHINIEQFSNGELTQQINREIHRGSEYRGEDSSEDYRDNHHEAERTEGFYYDQHHNEVCAGTDAWSCDCSRHPEGSEERRD